MLTSLFSRLHNVHEPHIFWYRSKENPQISRCYKSMMQMIAYLSTNLSGPFTYSYCKIQYVNLVQHCIHECRYLGAERIMMVTNVAERKALMSFADRTTRLICTYVLANAKSRLSHADQLSINLLANLLHWGSYNADK